MAQMSKISCKYGAPMGRRSYGDAPKGRIRLYEVRLDRGGYDDGGAYWGTGNRLYCAEGESVDGEGYRRFARAKNRTHAALRLRLQDSQLLRPCSPTIAQCQAQWDTHQGDLSLSQEAFNRKHGFLS